MTTSDARLGTGSRTLGIVGAGSIGQAILRGLQAGGNPYTVWAATKTADSARSVADGFGITATDRYDELVPTADIVLLCVKPVQVLAVLERLKAAGLRDGALVISVAAGVPLADMERVLGSGVAAIRAMPNVPALVGEGMTAIAGGTSATPAQMAEARAIFQKAGRCIEVPEQQLNAVTAVSGSGPAYIFLIIEALVDAGVGVGLPRETALELVTQTVLGAAKMVQSGDRHPAELRADVTTPAGTTIGALMVLEDGKIRAVLAQAVAEATRIAGKLGESKRPA